MKVRTRFAPSPTGSLHIGGVRTAIFNWLFARHHGGKFILRIEDTDQTRSTEESINEIVDAMKWLGLDWDEGPIRQSGRLTVYQDHVEKLIQSGEAYRCYCTPDELERKREEAKKRGDIYRYDGTCRDLKSQPEDQPFAVRLRTPEAGSVNVEDLIRGTIAFGAEEFDDFVIQKRDGFPTYNFAVVVDDATMNVSHVIRGDDHLANTPKQILVYRALDYQVPDFAHVSMILGSDKTKLSKRHGAASVVEYKNRGYLPQALVNYLTRLGWSHGDQEIFSREELIEKFTLDSVGKSAATFDPEKLLWLNGWYIRNKSAREIAEMVKPFFEQKGFEFVLDERFINIVDSLRERAKTLVELADSGDYFFTDEIVYDEQARKKFLKSEIIPVLESLIHRLSSLHSWTHDKIQVVFEEVMEETELKLGKIAQPVRVALTGGTVSPGIFEVIELLGKEKTLKRLKKAVSSIKSNEMN